MKFKLGDRIIEVCKSGVRCDYSVCKRYIIVEVDDMMRIHKEYIDGKIIENGYECMCGENRYCVDRPEHHNENYESFLI